MATAKKSAKKVAKKSAKKVAKKVVKKAPAKKVAKKSTVKKVVKKAPVKKASAKKVVKKSAKKSTKKAAQRVSISTVPAAPTPRVAPTPVVESAQTGPVAKKKSNGRPLLLIALFIVAASYLYSHKANDTVTATAPKPSASPTKSEIMAAKPTPSETITEAKPTQVVKAPTVVLHSAFTSTGANIFWSQVAGVTSYELKIQPSTSQEARLVTLTGTDNKYAIDKSDTVGKTTFTLTAILSDGTSVRSAALVLSGQY